MLSILQENLIGVIFLLLIGKVQSDNIVISFEVNQVQALLLLFLLSFHVSGDVGAVRFGAAIMKARTLI